IDISYQNTDPDFAAALLEVLLDGYEYALKRIADETKSKSIDFLEKRLKDVQHNREKMELALAHLQSDTGTTNVAMKNDRMLLDNSEFTQDLAEITSNIESTKREIAQIQKILGMDANDVKHLTRIMDDPQIKA